MCWLHVRNIENSLIIGRKAHGTNVGFEKFLIHELTCYKCNLYGYLSISKSSWRFLPQLFCWLCFTLFDDFLFFALWLAGFPFGRLLSGGPSMCTTTAQFRRLAYVGPFSWNCLLQNLQLDFLSFPLPQFRKCIKSFWFGLGASLTFLSGGL